MSVADLTSEREALGLDSKGDPPGGSANGGRSIRERGAEASTSASADTQDGLFDVVITSPELEAALDKRHAANEKRKAATKQYEGAHEEALGILVSLDGVDLDVKEGDELILRCGKYRIKRRIANGREVAFSTSPSARTTIKLIGED